MLNFFKLLKVIHDFAVLIQFPTPINKPNQTVLGHRGKGQLLMKLL